MGNKAFVATTNRKLGFKRKGRKVVGEVGVTTRKNLRPFTRRFSGMKMAL